MERLTEYFEVGAYTEKKNIIDVSDKLPLFENGVIMGKAIDRLAEFEDFMEEQGFEDLEHLKLRLCNLSNGAKYYVKWQELEKIIQENISIYNENAEGFLMQLGAKGAETFGEIILDKMQELEKE